MIENFTEVVDKYLKGELRGQFVTNTKEVLYGISKKDVRVRDGKIRYGWGCHYYDEEGYEVDWCDRRTGVYIDKFNEYNPNNVRYTYIRYEGVHPQGTHGLVKMVGDAPTFQMYFDCGYAVRFHNVCEHISYESELGRGYNLRRRCVYGNENPYILTLCFTSVSFFAIITEEEYNGIVDRLKEERIVDEIKYPESKYCKYIFDEKHSKKDKLKFVPDKIMGLYTVKDLEFREDIGEYVVKSPVPMKEPKSITVKIDRNKYKDRHFAYVEEESDFTKAVYKRVWEESICDENEETGLTNIDPRRGW